MGKGPRKRRREEEEDNNYHNEELHVEDEDEAEGDGDGDGNGDEDDDYEEFPFYPLDVKEHKQFLKSLPAIIKRGSSGKYGKLYSKTVGGVVRITINDNDDEGRVRYSGTGFVVGKTKHYALVMTCKHNLKYVTKRGSLEVIALIFNYTLTRLEVAKVYKADHLDCCLLVVVGNIESLVKLDVSWDDSSFGDSVFVTSCPRNAMRLAEGLEEEDDRVADHLRALQFTMARGNITHPFFLDYVKFSADGLTNGSSGSPMFNLSDSMGRVIAMCIRRTKAGNLEIIGHTALRMKTILEWILGNEKLKIFASLIFDKGNIPKLDSCLETSKKETQLEKNTASAAVSIEGNVEVSSNSGRGSEGGRGRRKRTRLAAATSAPLNPTGMDIDSPVDQSEPTYCICRNVSFGEMVQCDNLDCRIGRFHLGCVGLKRKPQGRWYCSDCAGLRKRRKDRSFASQL